MLKYGSEWVYPQTNLTYKIGKGYLQEGIQKYFIYGYGKSRLLSEQCIRDNFKEKL